MSLLNLPAEVLIKIFLNLDLQSSISCQRGNRFLHQLYQDAVELQYHTECEIAGVYDNPNCKLPVQTRLQMLRDRELAWAAPQHIYLIKLPPPPFDFDSAGVSGGQIYLKKAALSPGTLSKILTCPTSTHGEENMTEYRSCWMELSIEGLVGFSMCLDEHDLLVCLVARRLSDRSFDFQISLIQHSSGNPHPSAAEPMFSVFQSSNHPRNVTSETQVVGENLVLAFETPFKRLYFYNWKTGKLKSIHEHSGDSDFAFLRHDLLCHPQPERRSLDIYHIPSSYEGGPVRHIQTLFLPEVLFTGAYSSVVVNASPTQAGGGSFPEFVSPHKPFLERPERGLLVLKFFGSFPLSMIVHRKYLIGRLSPREHWSDETPRLTHWDEWKSGVTLIEASEICMLVSNGQNGQRCLVYEPGKVNEQSFSVLDFNPYRVRRAQAHTSVPNITGSLPYSMKSLPEEYTYNLFFLSATGLVGLDYTDGLNGTSRFKKLDGLHFG